MLSTDDLIMADEFLAVWKNSSLDQRKKLTKWGADMALILAEIGKLRKEHCAAFYQDRKPVGGVSGQFVKLSKVKKSESIERAITGILTNDPYDPILTGIHYNVDDQRIEATDRKIAIAVPTMLHGKNRIIAQICSRSFAIGAEIPRSFPYFGTIIPKDYSIFRDFDLDSARRKTEIAVKLNRVFKSAAVIEFDDKQVTPLNFNRVITALLKLGDKRVKIGATDRALYLLGMGSKALGIINVLPHSDSKVIAKIK